MGALVTVPLPVPDLLTARLTVDSANEAVRVVAPVMVTLHAPVPEHAPLHPVNVDPLAGDAVNVTLVLFAKLPAQEAPQSIPAGELVMTPLPVPVLLTVTVDDGGAKVAVTVVAAVTVTAHVPVPVQPPPPQPVKVDPEAALAVSVTELPLAKLLEQLAPHVMPAGVLVTVPLPAPNLTTARLYVFTVVAHAVFEYAEEPAALNAWTR